MNRRAGGIVQKKQNRRSFVIVRVLFYGFGIRYSGHDIAKLDTVFPEFAKAVIRNARPPTRDQVHDLISEPFRHSAASRLPPAGRRSRSSFKNRPV